MASINKFFAKLAGYFQFWAAFAAPAIAETPIVYVYGSLGRARNSPCRPIII
jgi:hypothetical protein